MKQRSNTPVLIAVVALSLGAMAVMNRAQYENRPRTEAEITEEQAQKTKDSSTTPPSDPEREIPLQQELVSVPAVQEFGNLKAKRKVIVGYSWTPEVQSDPKNANDGLHAFQGMLEKMSTKLNGSAHFRLVNTDVIRTQQPGVWLDGRLIGDLDLSTLKLGASHLAQNLMRELN
ncbi:hypothetical protein [Armatimonas sp.]|uniref:hypothetical protein n=1 Tax=Armatimonas sp. TaxID=1872638 RepID=UPI003751A050